MVDRQFLAARMVVETRRRCRRSYGNCVGDRINPVPNTFPITPIRARPIGANGLVSPIPASTAITDQPSSRTLLLTLMEERELVEVDGLVAGSAAAVPTAQHGLEEQHRLRQCQA